MAPGSGSRGAGSARAEGPRRRGRGRGRSGGLAGEPGRARSDEVFRVTTAAGFETVVRRALEADLRGVRVLREESGSITLRASARKADALAGLPYLSLVLLQLGRVEERSLDRAVTALSRTLPRRDAPVPLRAARTFRIRVSDGGSLVGVDRRARSALERAVSEWASLRPDPRGGGAEVWVTRRRGEREVSLALRLDQGPVEKPPKGSLKGDLAAALVRTVPPAAADVVFDPFAGGGAIPRARARYPCGQLVATDSDDASVAGLRRLARAGTLGPRAQVGRLDVRDADGVADFLGGRAVDVVMTDPPWGIFTSPDAGIDRLYGDMFTTFRAVLAPAGRVVVLTASIDAALAAARSSGFERTDSFPVLVNGKKASVIVAAPGG